MIWKRKLEYFMTTCDYYVGICVWFQRDTTVPERKLRHSFIIGEIVKMTSRRKFSARELNTELLEHILDEIPSDNESCVSGCESENEDEIENVEHGPPFQGLLNECDVCNDGNEN